MDQNSTINTFLSQYYSDKSAENTEVKGYHSTPAEDVNELAGMEKTLEILNSFEVSPNDTSVQIILEESMGHSTLETL
jgi:hypothetical protein